MKTVEHLRVGFKLGVRFLTKPSSKVTAILPWPRRSTAASGTPLRTVQPARFLFEACLLPTGVFAGLCSLKVFWLLNALLSPEQFWDLAGETEGDRNIWEPKSRWTESVFWFHVLEPILCLIATHASFLFDTGYRVGALKTWIGTERSQSYHCHCTH